VRALLLLLCASCNEFYGLDKTRLPPPDAPYACPELGAALPVFSSAVHQALDQQAASYHFNPSGTLAVAVWSGLVYVGTFDEPLVLDPRIVPPDNFLDAHPSPDGNRLYLETLAVGPPVTFGFVMYERAGDAWRYVEEVPLKGAPSTVFRGVADDRIIFNGTTSIVEYERVGGMWLVQEPMHDRVALQIASRAKLAITSDGLRAVYLGDGSMMYTDRPSIQSSFRTPQPLEGVPKVSDAQLTDDCGRVYYSGLGTAFYSKQQ
jgi:hypothetical protein